VQQARLITIGFVAGLAMAGGAFLLLRDNAAVEQERARVGELKALVERLENAVTKFSTLANDAPAGNRSSTHVSTSVAAPAPRTSSPSQLQAIAEADTLVDLGIQSGRWTQQQQEELGAAVADLDLAEQGRIRARVSKAVNDGQLKFDPSP